MSHIKKKISGRTKRSSSRSTIHHNNPLFNSQSHHSPIKRKMQLPKPESPIRKKTFIKPYGSPNKTSFIQAGSPLRQPRSPLSPKNINITSKISCTSPLIHKKVLNDTPRPKSKVFHQSLNNMLRTGPPKPNNINNVMSPNTRRRATSCYSPSTKHYPNKFQNRSSNLCSTIKNNIEIPASLPPPPKIPTECEDFPENMDTIEIPKGNFLKNVKFIVDKQSPLKRNYNNNIDNSTIDDIINKIKQKSTRQMGLAVYQSIQLFCCNSQYHRSSKILQCLLQFDIKQLVQHIIFYLHESRDLIDRRNAADTLSSLLLYSMSDNKQKEYKLLVKTLSLSNYMSDLLYNMKDDDIVLNCYMTSIFASLNLDNSIYLGSHSKDFHLSSCKSHLNDISKIISMLKQRNLEIKEAALTAIICMGPTAAKSVNDLGDLLLNEKNIQIKILACRALYEIGSPYALKNVHIIQEIYKKEKDETLKNIAKELLNYLSSAKFPSLEGISNISNINSNNSIIINEYTIKNAIIECQNALKGSLVTTSDLKQYFLHYYPNIQKENPNWKLQLRDSLRILISNGDIKKNPATFSII